MFWRISPNKLRAGPLGVASLLAAICLAAIALGGAPSALAQTKGGNNSSSNIGEYRNQDSLKRLRKEKQQAIEKEKELVDNFRETKVGTPQSKEAYEKLAKQRTKLDNIKNEIDLRTANKDQYLNLYDNAKREVEDAKKARTKSRELIERIFCDKKKYVDWNKALKEAQDLHKKNKDWYSNAKKRLKTAEDVSTQRFGSGELEKYREAKLKQQEQLRRWRPRFKFSKDSLDLLYREKGTKTPSYAEDDWDEDYDDLSSFEVDPERCHPGTLTALTFPDEPQTVRIAVQIPEVCVGTTYYVHEQEIFEETPRVTDDGDEPRDVPRSEIPAASIPSDVPDDSDEPRDVPKEETPKEVPVASVPESADEPRDVPTEPTLTEETPEEETPEQETPQTSVPVTDTPGDEPRDTPFEEETDLGLVKAAAEIVALAVIDVQTGEKVTKAGVKLLPNTPPLPGSDVIEASSDGAETFDDAAFFEADAEGGFTDEAGEIELASSLVIPIGDPGPADNQQDKSDQKDKAGDKEKRKHEAKNKRPFNKVPSADEIEKMNIDELVELKRKFDNGFDSGLSKLDKQIDDKFEGFNNKKKDLRSELDDTHTKLDNEYRNSEYAGEEEEKLKAAKLRRDKQDATDKYELERDKLVEDHLRRMPEEFQKKYREAKEEAAKVDPAYKLVRQRINKATDREYNEAVERDLKRQAEEKKKAELEPKGQKESEGKGSNQKKQAEDKKSGVKPESGKEAVPEVGASATERLALNDGAGPPSGAAPTRRVSLPIDTEPKDPFVAAVKSAAAFAEMMRDEVVASVATNVFAIGEQPIVQFAVPRRQTDQVKERIESNDWVSWFKPDPCWSKQDVDDPYFKSKGLWGQKYDDQWAIKRAGFTEEMISSARDSADAQPVTVAVIDTGIDWYHPDLDQKNLWRNEGEVPDNGIDDDGNGYVDDVIGWNFVDQSNKPWDYDGHGTFIAGVIGAASGNGKGITGVNPKVRLMPLKALDAFGQGNASMSAEAIAYAADNGAKVINLSLGGKGLSPAAELAIDYAISKGALVVVAAGNSATDVSGFGPAGVDGVVTVSATDQRDRRAGFSNWGEEVDIAAPGIDVMSLRARNTDLLSVTRDVEYEKGEGIIGDARAYYRASGTSFAAPIVSGAASLIMSLNPDLDASAVRRMLLNSARDTEVPGIDNYTGYGVLDVGAALEANPAHSVESRITAAKPVRVEGKSMLRLEGTADADDFGEATLSLGKGEDPEKWLTIRTRITKPVQGGVLMDIPAAAFAGSKEWTIRLITKHKDGSEREARFAVTLG